MNHSNLHNKIAVIDFDGTLIEGQSQKLLIKYFYHEGYLSNYRYFIIIIWFILFKIDLINNTEKIFEFALSSIKNKKFDLISNIFDSFFEAICKPAIYKNSNELIKTLRNNGFYIIIISSAIEPIISRVTKYLEIDEYLCTKLEIKNGIYTGKVNGVPIFGSVKVSRFKEFINQKKMDLKEIYVFTDHYSDIDLLKIATKQFAVNPSLKLWKCAELKKWPVLYLNNNESFQHFKSNTKF